MSAPLTTLPDPDRTADASTSHWRWRCGTLADHWYVAAQSGQVTNRRPRASVVLEVPLVLWRDGDGQAVAQLDRCLHRNAKLSAGALFDGRIGCPYHGWTYDAAGRCVHVPSAGPVDNNEASCTVRRQLETFPVHEADGLVWVWMGQPDRAQDADVPLSFVFGGNGWASYRMITHFDGAVTDLVENFMDVPHTAFVHAGWFRRTQTPRPSSALVESSATGVCVTYDRPADVIGFARWLLNPDGLAVTHTDRFFMPNITRVDYRWGQRRHFVIQSQVTPVTRDSAIVYTAIAFRFGALNAVARRLLPAYTRAVINQDVAIMANQTANLRRFGGRDFGGTDADAVHRAIEALRDAASAGAPPPAPRTQEISLWL